jgi:hypothetical protein
MDNILQAGSAQAQAAVLRAVMDHPSLAPENAGSLQICLQAILLPDED